MDKLQFKIDPYEQKKCAITLTEDIIRTYSLDTWADGFSLMTAGYRDNLNPSELNDPNVAFNSLVLAILGTAKANVFNAKLLQGEQAHAHVGGETRPHTQEFIAILARVYAAKGIKVHLRSGTRTTPIWYSSFGIFYNEFQSGDNLTASHSPYFKGGWKPLDAKGQQLLKEENDIIEQVKNIVKNRETIYLSSWVDENILFDFNVDSAYFEYQQTVVLDKSRTEIVQALNKGLKVKICTVGGSMKATTEKLFPLFGIPTGPAYGVQYVYGEEDSQYHGLGQNGEEHFGPDPSKSQLYKTIGAENFLLTGESNLFFIWDPDGDRFNIITIAKGKDITKAKEIGLTVKQYPEQNMAIIYFTPNQIFLMLIAYRIRILKKMDLLDKYDWFIACSISSSRAIKELAEFHKIPVIYVRVGFKYMGELSSWLSNRVSDHTPFKNAVGDEIRIGKNPRALIMCEESGGAVFGGTKLLNSKNGSKSQVALHEKDGMQLGLMTLSLASYLHNREQSFASYFCNLIKKYNIQHSYFNRADISLYKENLKPKELLKARAKGDDVKKRIMTFFNQLAKHAANGKTMEELDFEIASKIDESSHKKLPPLTRICLVGNGTLLEGTYLEFGGFWFLIRASGTDAAIRYYIEGKDELSIKKYQQTLINLKI